MAIARYSIDKMRVVKTSGKTAEKNPDRLFTVTGTFWPLVEKNGKLVRGENALTIPSKNIDRTDAFILGPDPNDASKTIVVGPNPEFAIDLAAGTLSMPAGERGRKASVGMTAESVTEFLASLATPAVEETPEASAK